MTKDSLTSGLREHASKAGITLQTSTLVVIMLGGWQARGYLEETLSEIEGMKASIGRMETSIQSKGSAEAVDSNTTLVKTLAGQVDEIQADLEDLRRCVEDRKKCKP